MLFTEQHEIHLGSDLVADGTSEVLTAVEDMQGFDELTYIVKLGDVDTAAVMTFTAKENTADSTSSPTPTAVTDGAVSITEASGNLDDKLVVINVKRNKMTKRYQFLSITATVESFEIDSIITIKSCAREVPVTQPSEVVSLTQAAA